MLRPTKSMENCLKNILSRTQYQDSWLIGYITEVTDVTNREYNITIQGQTNTATMSMILAADTAWEYKPDLVTLTAFHTRNNRLKNLENNHNATYLNSPPVVKKKTPAKRHATRYLHT